MGALLKTSGQFRVFLIYQIFSTLGNGIFSMFMLLSVHLVYGNVLYTGIAGFLMAAPICFSFVAGPVVDRGKKVKIMRITTLLEFGALALLTFTPLLENFGVMFMFAVIIIMSISAMFESPAGQALLPHIVKEEEILPANQLISITTMAGGVVLAVLLFAVLGQGDNIRLIFGLSTGFLAGALLFSIFLREANAKTKPNAQTIKGYRADLIAGMKFMGKNVLLFFIVVDVVQVVVGQIAYVSSPAFIEYYAGAQGYIVLSVAGMVGSIIASTFLGRLGKKFTVGQLLFAFYLFGGVARIFFVFVLPSSFYGALGITVVMMMIFSAAGIVKSTLSQKIPPKNMVGRVGTMQTTTLAVFAALGALAGAFIGRAVGDVAHIFIARGVIVTLTAFYFILVPSIRKLPKFNEIVREVDDSEEGSNDAVQ